MKKLAAIFLAVTVLSFPAWAEKDGWSALNQETKRHLINLINIDTSLPEPDELSAARYIYKELNKVSKHRIHTFNNICIYSSS